MTETGGSTSVRRLLTDIRHALEARHYEAHLESELLVMHALGLDRVQLYQSLEDDISAAQHSLAQSLAARRMASEPVPYITGHKEFFGLDFELTPAVLIPRADTEALVELAVHFARERDPGDSITIADVGTGSGIIAVSLAVELPNATITATDTSSDALAVAACNAKRHGVAGRIAFVEGDLLSPLAGPVDLIAANLPYVTTGEWETLPPEIRDNEPRSALDGGDDGLDLIRRLLAEAPRHLKAGGAVFLEIGDRQGVDAAALGRTAFPDAEVTIEPDLAGRDRVVVIR